MSYQTEQIGQALSCPISECFLSLFFSSMKSTMNSQNVTNHAGQSSSSPSPARRGPWGLPAPLMALCALPVKSLASFYFSVCSLPSALLMGPGGQELIYGAVKCAGLIKGLQVNTLMVPLRYLWSWRPC